MFSCAWFIILCSLGVCGWVGRRAAGGGPQHTWERPPLRMAIASVTLASAPEPRAYVKMRTPPSAAVSASSAAWSASVQLSGVPSLMKRMALVQPRRRR